jgi:predicted MFS family arabinose efflux permease
MDVQDRFPLLHDSDVRRYLGGQLVAEIGSRITREGLPIVAIVAAGATAPQLGILAALATLPLLLIGNLVGHWVDRTRRRPLLVGASLARAAVLLAIPLLFWIHLLAFGAIALVTLLASAAGVLIAVSRHAYLPALVNRNRIEEGNELSGTAESIGETVGPGLMGVLIEWLGAPAAILFDAVANVATALAVLQIRRPEPHPRPVDLEEDGRLSLAGLSRVWSRVTRHPVLKPLLWNAGSSAFFGGFFSTLYELYVLKTLHLSPFLLGLLITLGGLGSLVGTRLYRRLRTRWGLGRMMWVTYLASALLNLAVPSAHGAAWLAFGLLFVGQFGGDMWATMFEIGATTIQQSETPDHWLGRVHGTFRALGGGMEVAGALAAGPVALWMGVRGAFWVAVAGVLLSGLWLMPRALRRVEGPPAAFWSGFDVG